jgi:hypothetical protein
MWLTARKTATRVRRGRVQHKNNHAWTPRRDEPLIIREAPARGYRHLLTVRDVEEFVALLPPALMEGIEHVVLSNDTDAFGWCCRGIVAVCAWPRELYQWWPVKWRDDHFASLQRYGVAMTLEYGGVFCDFSESQVRAFQLLRVLTHELGHHADLMATRTRRCAFGEAFAERHAVTWEEKLWPTYVDRFGWPA